jgi:hypothetical protein
VIHSAANCLSAATAAPSCADPRSSICRDPHREDHTTRTTVAPDDDRTVRTYATAASYDPSQCTNPHQQTPAAQQTPEPTQTTKID